MLETTSEARVFVEESLLGRDALRWVSQETGLSPTAAEEMLRTHIGICLDACHAAVEFETATESVRQLVGADIRIAKAQLSVALRVPEVTEAARAALAQLDEPTYLHQVVANDGGILIRHLDIQSALAAETSGDGQEWRIHYHVPIFRSTWQSFETTRPFLVDLLALHRAHPFTSHLEVETYTWGILNDAPSPEELPPLLAQELAFVREKWGGGTATDGGAASTVPSGTAKFDRGSE